MKIAYFDCFAGISGDMTLGALLDLGVPLEWLEENLSAMPLDGFTINKEATHINGIRAARVQIDLSEGHGARHWADIRRLIENAPLDKDVIINSLKMFEKVAISESEIHGVPVEKVHFHEVGALDSIIDMVGTALCVKYLGIEAVFASKIPLGSGFVKCSHGTLPVPAPATLSILKGVPVYGGNARHEMVTPTGAAIITSYATSFGRLPEMEVESVGYGAGQREVPEHPNVLRVAMGQLSEKNKSYQMTMNHEEVQIIETCIDDMNPELFGFLMERLFEDGALDVYWIPVFMKKNRPGTMLQVLCKPAREKGLVHRIMTETSTSGIRAYKVGRYTLHRETVTVDSPYGSITVKKMIDPDGRERMAPEYDVCREIALANNVPLQEVYAEVVKAIRK
ncbi:MAG: nickel pincer cofactor biosynthesis protein LarC [Thermodesulfobacteriota bacterium]